jgi:ubiquinone/menaquinone biosynthesis C-methylase UbiE
MFDKSAHLYDLAYSFEDYAGESAWVRNAVHARVPQARSLLDVACGTGEHLEHLGGNSTARDSISTLSSWYSHSNEPA